MKKRIFTLLLAASLSIGACVSADDGSVEVWPAGSTVNFIVPAKAGGGTDLYTRYVTTALTEIYPDVNFIVTNYDTAEVGLETVKKADGDGLTLTAAACTNMDNYLSGSSNVNPNEDYVAVGKINDGGPQAWIAAPDAPYNNMTELGEYIKEHPMELTAGVALGGTSHIIWYGCLDALGVADDVNYVQCASEADKLTNIASGAIDLGNCSLNNAYAYEQDGRLKILGVVGPASATKDVCAELMDLDLSDAYLSMSEQDIDFSWDAGYYVMAPASASDEVCSAVNEKLQAIYENESFQKGMTDMATLYTPKNLEETRADWEAEWDFQVEMETAMGLNIR